MRNQRGGLVSNLDQYIFSHFVLVEYYFGKNYSSSNKPSDFVVKIQEAMQESAIKRFVDRLDKATEHCRTISLGGYSKFQCLFKQCNIFRFV